MFVAFIIILIISLISEICFRISNIIYETIKYTLVPAVYRLLKKDPLDKYNLGQKSIKRNNNNNSSISYKPYGITKSSYNFYNNEDRYSDEDPIVGEVRDAFDDTTLSDDEAYMYYEIMTGRNPLDEDL